MPYYLFVNNKSEGPFTKEELKQIAIYPDILIRTSETDNWIPASEMDELQSYFNRSANVVETSKNNSVIFSNHNSLETKYWLWIIIGIIIILGVILLLFLVQSQKQQELQLKLNKLSTPVQQNEPSQKQPNKIDLE